MKRRVQGRRDGISSKLTTMIDDSKRQACNIFARIWRSALIAAHAPTAQEVPRCQCRSTTHSDSGDFGVKENILCLETGFFSMQVQVDIALEPEE